MAQQLTCDICEDEPAIMMQSSLSNGETIAIGQACLPLISLTTVIQVLGQYEPSGLAIVAGELTPLVTEIRDLILKGTAPIPPPAAGSGQADGATGNEPGKDKDSAQERKERPARRRGTTRQAADDGML